MDLDGSDKPLLGRTEDERDTVAVRDGFDLDIGVVAGAIQAFDCFADFGDVEGRSGGERDEAGEIGASTGCEGGSYRTSEISRPSNSAGGVRSAAVATIVKRHAETRQRNSASGHI